MALFRADRRSDELRRAGSYTELLEIMPNIKIFVLLIHKDGKHGLSCACIVDYLLCEINVFRVLRRFARR
jgi:hypothetical protein